MCQSCLPLDHSAHNKPSPFSLLTLYLYSNVKLVFLSISHSSSSPVCPAILQMTLLLLLLLPNKLSFLPLRFALFPTSPHLPPPPSASHCTCFPPALSAPSPNVTFFLPPPPPLFPPAPILPLVSLMNGFTAGKVLIFIPLSDFCWLLLISNTQRKASESINKEMNTLHPVTQRLSQSFTRDAGPPRGPGPAFVLIEFSSALESQHVCEKKTKRQNKKASPLHRVSGSVAGVSSQNKQDRRETAWRKVNSTGETCSAPSHPSSFTRVHRLRNVHRE